VNIRLIQIAAQLLTVVVCAMTVAGSAQDFPLQSLNWDAESQESSWLPTMLLSTQGSRRASVDSNPFVQEIPVNPGFVDLPVDDAFQNGRMFEGDYLLTNIPQSSQGSSSRSARSGTGLDSLPSFRGIKGIKNLPGGVGTLLMANPHIGMTSYPEQSTDQPGTTLSMQRYYFQGGVPVYHRGNDTFVITSHMDATSIYTNAILPTTKQTFPSQLYNVAFGMNYFHPYENGNVGGIVFDVGSASDKPFQSGKEILASGTAFLLMPQDEQGAWFIGVNASTNSQVLFGLPIPGGGYFYHPSDDFQAIFGFPFSLVSWRPARDWQLQYVWAFLTTMHARAVYQLNPDWQFYAGFDWTNENWRLAERVNEQNHFFYYEKKLATGFLWWFKPNVGFEFSGGWAFDRYFTEAHGFTLVGDNTVNIGSGPYVSAQFDLRF
jgi:hypothetical protein